MEIEYEKIARCGVVAGHVCGGLVESAASLRVAFDVLFSDGFIDRTDLRIVSNNSACGGDVASYLTGGSQDPDEKNRIR